MNIFQALLIAFFGWSTSIWAPVWLGGLGGWYTMGRPLIAGTIIGIILGDIRSGILYGAAVQALYIGLVTPGGSMSPDMNLATWCAIPLALVSGAPVEYAVTIAVPLAVVGMFGSQLVKAANLPFVHKQDDAIAKGNLVLAERLPVYGQITNFTYRFFAIFIICFVGASIVPTLVSLVPLWMNDILSIFGRLLPLTGFMLLLSLILKKKIDLIYFVFGFILRAALGWAIIPTVAFSAVLAYIDFKANNSKKEAKV